MLFLLKRHAILLDLSQFIVERGRVERGVFGVPTIELDGRLFWGLDALPMVRAALLNDPWFDGPAWDDAAEPRPGVVRAG